MTGPMRRRRSLLKLGVAFATAAGVLMTGAASVHAHALGLIRARVIEVASSIYAFEIKLPLAAQSEERTVGVLARCRIVRSQLVRTTSAMPEIHLLVDCGGAPLSSSDALLFPWAVQGAFVSFERRDRPAAGRFFDGMPAGVSVPLTAFASSTNRRVIDIARRYVT